MKDHVLVEYVNLREQNLKFYTKYFQESYTLKSQSSQNLRIIHIEKQHKTVLVVNGNNTAWICLLVEEMKEFNLPIPDQVRMHPYNQQCEQDHDRVRGHRDRDGGRGDDRCLLLCQTSSEYAQVSALRHFVCLTLAMWIET